MPRSASPTTGAASSSKLRARPTITDENASPSCSTTRAPPRPPAAASSSSSSKLRGCTPRIEKMASSSRSTPPRRLDPELVQFLYLNCEKDQLVIYLDDFLDDLDDRACHAIRRSAMLHLPRSIESIGFESRGSHQRRAEIVRQLARDSRSAAPQPAGDLTSVPQPLEANSAEGSAEIVRQLAGNSSFAAPMTVPDLTFNSSHQVMPTADGSERETFQQGGKITWSSIPTKKPKNRLPVSNAAENENNKYPTTGTVKQEAAVRVSAAGEVLGEHPSIGLDAAENGVLDAEQKRYDIQSALHQMEGKINLLEQRFRDPDLDKEAKKSLIQQIRLPGQSWQTPRRSCVTLKSRTPASRSS
uniref:Uncharacterized protein n=1 Tax=Oryza glumipatula TaxID=40148 RepID=A0A0E0A5L5_9ORYZ